MFGLHWSLAWATARSRPLRRLVRGAPRPLVREGGVYLLTGGDRPKIETALARLTESPGALTRLAELGFLLDPKAETATFILEAATQAVASQISSLGSNLLVIRPGQRMGPGGEAAPRSHRSPASRPASARTRSPRAPAAWSSAGECCRSRTSRPS